MATILNAGTTTNTAFDVITDTTGAMAIQTSGTNAISISNAQVVSLTNPLLPASGGTGITSLGSGIATFLGAPTSANLAAALTDETGTGSAVFSNSPALTGTPTAPTASAGTNTTQIATTAYVVANAVLTGTIQMWPTTAAPSGYLLCNGAAVSRSTYANLFAVIATTFGVGDGSTTFNLPNYKDTMPIGVGTTIATSIGATGGSKDAVIVSHSHTATVTDPGHSHNPGVNFATTNSGSATGISSASFSGIYQTGIATAVTGISVSNSTTGVSGTGANMPPYMGINFIIKT